MLRGKLGGRLGGCALCAAALSFVSCSPTCILEVRFTQPGGLVINAERFFVTGAKACPPADIAAPAPGNSGQDVEYVRSRVLADGIDITAAFRGRQCRVQVTGWYDADADGQVDAGDWVGSSQAVDITDEGASRGNSARAANVTLAQKP